MLTVADQRLDVVWVHRKYALGERMTESESGSGSILQHHGPMRGEGAEEREKGR